MQEGRKEGSICLFYYYIVVFVNIIDYWTGLDWFYTVKGDSLPDLYI